MSIADPRAVARQALRDYLATQLTDVSGLTVNAQWPIPQQQLVSPTITVISSPSIKAEYHNARLWKTTPTTGVNATALYSYGRAELNMQLDVWADFEPTRDALNARIETEINRDPLETLFPDPTRPKGFARKPGLVLRLTNYYSIFCEFIFETPASQLGESKEQAVIADWRSTFAGRAIMYLMDQDAVALMQTVTMRLAVNGYAAEDIDLSP